MSLANKIAREGMMGDADGGFVGDPGIFGTIKNIGAGIVKTAIDIAPGPIGFAARKARGFVQGRRGGRRVDQIQVRARPGVGSVRVQAPAFRRFTGAVRGRGTTGRAPSADIEFGFGGGQIDDPVFLNGGAPVGVVPGSPGQAVPVCAPGFRPNKSGYFRRSPAGGVVFIQPQSVCVKSRRIDPGNTRATKRAIARIRAAKRLKDALGGVTVHKKPC